MFITADTTNLNVKARLFRGLSDLSRLKILETLRTEALTVGEILEKTWLSQSTVSNHLACLGDCGLVAVERLGKFVSYRLSDPRVDERLTLADTLLASVARGIYEYTRYSVDEAPND